MADPIASVLTTGASGSERMDAAVALVTFTPTRT
jgi:hypothetical protein